MGKFTEAFILLLCLAAVVFVATSCAPRLDLPSKADCDAVGGHWQTQSSTDEDQVYFQGSYQWRCIPLPPTPKEEA